MKCDASESSDPHSKLQIRQVDLRMLEMERGICSVIRAKQSSSCRLSVGRSETNPLCIAVEQDEVIHRHAHNAAHNATNTMQQIVQENEADVEEGQSNELRGSIWSASTSVPSWRLETESLS